MGPVGAASRAIPRSVLMWSHCAENHHGVCLQFECMKDFPTLGHAMRVDYREDLSVVNWIVGFYRDVKHILLAKHPCWLRRDPNKEKRN
jgi:hypothetical protein